MLQKRMSIVMHKIAIGLAALTIATACSALSASALPGGGTLGVANSGGDDFTTVGFGRAGFGGGGFGRGGFGRGGFGFRGGFGRRFGFHRGFGPAPSPSTAVSDLGLAFTVDSIVGLHSVDLVVDGKIHAHWRVDRQQDATHEASVAGAQLEGSRYLAAGAVAAKTKGRQVTAPCWFRWRAARRQ